MIVHIWGGLEYILGSKAGICVEWREEMSEEDRGKEDGMEGMRERGKRPAENLVTHRIEKSMFEGT